MPEGSIVLVRAFNSNHVFSKKTKDIVAQTIEYLKKHVGLLAIF